MIDTSRALASLQREFPAPRIDPAWVQECALALADDGQEPSVANIREQFLFSDLASSTLPSNLIPLDAHLIDLFPRPTLVQLVSITEIGNSAFQLQTVQEQRKDVLSGATRIRRMDDDERDDEDEQDGRLPAYPRSMLKLEVTDGERVIKALEYQRLPGIKLAETPLGAKMVLHNVRALRGTLLLSPDNTRFLGYQVAHLEAQQPVRFTNSLLQRMGKPIPDAADSRGDTDEAGAGSRAAPAVQQSSARRLTLPPAATSHGPRAPQPSRVPFVAPEPVASPYFRARPASNATASSSRRPAPAIAARPPAQVVDDLDDDDTFFDDSFIRQIDAAEARATSAAPRDMDQSSDYGMDDELDSAILHQLDEVEAIHIPAASFRPPPAGARRQESTGTSASTLTSGSTSTAAAARRRALQAGSSAPAPSRKRKAVQQPLLVRSDGSDDEGTDGDKENAWPDVIEISD